ncbi:MAG TPA: hypothetical protein VGJ20_11905 [Xanthobacteraceae bacterium]
MSIDHTTVRDVASRVREGVRSRLTKPAVFAGCLLINSLAMATTAAAHVKWFVNCNVSDDPLPAKVVFSSTFFLFLALFLIVFSVACIAERTALGAILSGLLDRCTAPLHARADELLRAVAAVSFALLWADGTVILTPELKASSTSLSAIQLLIPIYLFSRATFPAAGVGIIVLYGYGVATYGLFHMLDYPVFLGLGTFFILSVSENSKFRAFRYHFLRWTVALSLLWPAMEKFLYPSWVAAIAIVHPELTLGFPVATVVTAAGIVEFGLSFALFWTPLVRRLGALALILLLTAATFDFGKVDGIGHLMIITILLVVLADPEGKPQRCQPALALLVSPAALLATIFFYAGGHALYYGKGAALAPLMSGTALLAFIALCVLGLPYALLRIMEWLIIGRAGSPRYASSPRTSQTTAWAGSRNVIPERQRRSAGFARGISLDSPRGNGSRASPAWGLHPGSYRPSRPELMANFAADLNQPGSLSASTSP